jgi:hypothetical protein
MKSAWGSDDPIKAAFPFSHGLALAEAGHEVQIYLLGEAVVSMRKVVADSVTPVGWPVVGDFLNKLSASRCKSTLAAPVREDAELQRRTWRDTEQSSAARPFSLRSLNEPTTSSQSRLSGQADLVTLES